MTFALEEKKNVSTNFLMKSLNSKTFCLMKNSWEVTLEKIYKES